jgi:transposase
MNNYKRFIPEGKTVFIGIDLHQKSWHVTALVEDQKVFSSSISPDIEALFKLLERFGHNQIEVAYEAGCFGFWLYESLMANSINCLVVPPSLVPVETGNRVKTDRRDSRKLAYLLAGGMLKEVWVPNPKQLAHRQVTRRRRQLIGDRVRVQHRIKSELRCFGFPVPVSRGPWSRTLVRWLKAIRFPDYYQQQSFKQLLIEYENLCKQFREQTRLLEQLAATEAYASQVELLRTIPGIGLISAMELLLELGDISRFARGEQLAAYLGLTPSQYSSGDKIRLGRITRTGKASLRATLTEAAWRTLKKDRELQTVFVNLKQRCGSKRAIIAVARRLALRARRILLDQKPYNLVEAA